MAKDQEYCGRCAMTSVVSTAQEGADDDERDPFGSERIEVDEADLRRVSPSAWLSGVVRRIDEVATRLTYGR